MIEHTQCPSVVSIPWLRDIRVHWLKVLDQWNNFYPVGTHSKRVSLHNTLLTMDNIICHIPSSQDEIGMATIAFKKNPNSHKWRTVNIIQIQLISLNKLFASIRIKPQISSVQLCYQIDWTRCTDPSITSFNKLQIWSSLHTLVASYPVTLSTHFAKIRHYVSPTPTGCTPESLSNAIRLPKINALELAHGILFV